MPRIGHIVSNETRRKISLGNSGKIRSVETRKKISETNKKIGRIPPSKAGVPMSEETREKIRKANTGHRCSELAKEKLRKFNLGLKKPQWVKDKMKLLVAKRGADNPMWKGGITPLMQKIRNSTEYQEWRMAVFKRDWFTCQLCNQKSGKEIKLVAHHLDSFSGHPQKRTSLENGVCLCRKCHINFHHLFGNVTNKKQFQQYKKTIGRFGEL